MPAHTFDYALIRVVPRVEREEFLNAGAIVYCRALDFLGARVALDAGRLRALAPGVDVEAVERGLAHFPGVAAGAVDAGPIARLPQAERFHWLVSPRSTIFQTSAVHSGLCQDPQGALDRLLATMVR